MISFKLKEISQIVSLFYYSLFCSHRRYFQDFGTVSNSESNSPRAVWYRAHLRVACDTSTLRKLSDALGTVTLRTVSICEKYSREQLYCPPTGTPSFRVAECSTHFLPQFPAPTPCLRIEKSVVKKEVRWSSQEAGRSDEDIVDKGRVVARSVARFQPWKGAEIGRVRAYKLHVHVRVITRYPSFPLSRVHNTSLLPIFLGNSLLNLLARRGEQADSVGLRTIEFPPVEIGLKPFFAGLRVSFAIGFIRSGGFVPVFFPSRVEL